MFTFVLSSVALSAPPALPDEVRAAIACTDTAQVRHAVTDRVIAHTEHHYDARGARLASVTERDGATILTTYSQGPRSRSWMSVRHDADGAHFAGLEHRVLDDAGRTHLSFTVRPGETRARLWMHQTDRTIVHEWGASPGRIVTMRGPHGPVERVVFDPSGNELGRETWSYDALGRVRADAAEASYDTAPFWVASETADCGLGQRDTAAVARN